MPAKKNEVKDAFSEANDPIPEVETVSPEAEIAVAVTERYDKVADAIAPILAKRFYDRLETGVKREIIEIARHDDTFTKGIVATMNNGNIAGAKSLMGV